RSASVEQLSPKNPEKILASLVCSAERQRGEAAHGKMPATSGGFRLAGRARKGAEAPPGQPVAPPGCYSSRRIGRMRFTGDGRSHVGWVQLGEARLQFPDVGLEPPFQPQYPQGCRTA